MALLCLILNLLAINVGSASGCIDAKFTENPEDTVFSYCPRSSSDVEAHWRGELSFTHTETFITVQWKKMVQRPECVIDMKFFVDSKEGKGSWEERDVLGKNNEDVKINTVGSLMLKVSVLYRLKPFFKLSCLEATANISTTTTTTTTTTIAPINNTSQSDNVIPLVVGAFAGGNV